MKFKSLLVLLFTFSLGLVNAQDVKLKKNDVIVDGKKCFKFERKSAATEFSLYTLNDDEILFILRNNNETRGYAKDDFNQITFIKDNRKLETATLAGNSFKWFVETLIKEKVLDLEGNINPEKLDIFFTKYDEKITDRTIRN